MDLVDDYRLRAPTVDDLASVVDALAADELDDAGQVVLGEDFVRSEWDRAGFDLAADAWAAIDLGGAVVGYAQAQVEGGNVESWGTVDPAHRGRGIGSALVGRIDARAGELLTTLPDGRFRHSVNARDDAAATILAARGLRQVRHFWHMRIDLDGPIEPGPDPDGIELRAFDPDTDLRAVHAILDEAFAEDPGHQPEPFERWVEEDTADYDPTLWLVAVDHARPVGVITASGFEDRGWVDYLAVLEDVRGRGVGAALLRRTFAAFAARGTPVAFVSVDAENVTGATALYERVGMRVVKRWDRWERPPDVIRS
jgi:mycothiol synthase